MRVNTEHKFVYVSNPKVCTHTIYDALEKHYSKNLVRLNFHQNQVPKEYSKYFRWTLCRNPYSRAVSIWWSGCRLHPPDRYGFRKGCGAADDFTRFAIWLSETTYEQRVIEPLMFNQSQWLGPAMPFTKILKVENLQENLKTLPFWKPEIKLVHLNTTAGKIKVQSKEEGEQIVRPHWKDMYKDNRAVAAILNWAQEDFEKLNYSKEVRA